MDRNCFSFLAGNVQELVRLVRACGSKLNLPDLANVTLKVRLVRACGSKLFIQRKWSDNYAVRLVRACGSKLTYVDGLVITGAGQARKSLWIETFAIS